MSRGGKVDELRTQWRRRTGPQASDHTRRTDSSTTRSERFPCSARLSLLVLTPPGARHRSAKSQRDRSTTAGGSNLFRSRSKSRGHGPDSRRGHVLRWVSARPRRPTWASPCRTSRARPPIPRKPALPFVVGDCVSHVGAGAYGVTLTGVTSSTSSRTSHRRTTQGVRPRVAFIRGMTGCLRPARGSAAAGRNTKPTNLRSYRPVTLVGSVTGSEVPAELRSGASSRGAGRTRV
jgi:hypothetical protein